MDCSRFNTLTIFCPAMHIPTSISRYLYVDIGMGKVVFYIYIMYGIGIVIGSLEQIWGVILWQRGHLSSQDYLIFLCSPYSFQKSWLSCSGPLAVPIMNRWTKPSQTPEKSYIMQFYWCRCSLCIKLVIFFWTSLLRYWQPVAHKLRP